jgi:hypothetical protein
MSTTWIVICSSLLEYGARHGHLDVTRNKEHASPSLPSDSRRNGERLRKAQLGRLVNLNLLDNSNFRGLT